MIDQQKGDFYECWFHLKVFKFIGKAKIKIVPFLYIGNTSFHGNASDDIDIYDCTNLKATSEVRVIMIPLISLGKIAACPDTKGKTVIRTRTVPVCLCRNVAQIKKAKAKG